MRPLIVVNFKTYETAHGVGAEQLARAMEVADSSTDLADFVAVVSAFDLSSVVAAAPSLQVWTQHLDPIGFGSNTGWLHPSTAMERGASGTIINHAEHKVSLDHVENLLEQLPEGFPVCACAADLDEARALAERLIQAGAKALEFSFDTPRATALCSAFKEHERKICLGMGTVTDPLRQIMKGKHRRARFFFSAINPPEFIKAHEDKRKNKT